jgi:hypothetical protein
VYLSVGREHRRLHRHRVRMGWDVVGQDEDGCLAGAYEMARHGEHEFDLELAVGSPSLGGEKRRRSRRGKCQQRC